ncbi:MAG: hypothetical protein WDM78_23560 [Puia sp.]
MIDPGQKGKQISSGQRTLEKSRQRNAFNRGSRKKLITVCTSALQLTANLTILINPFLPTTAKKLLGMMKVVDRILEWENAGKIDLLKTGYSLRAPELLFRKN